MATDAAASAWQASQLFPHNRPPSFVLNLGRMPRGMLEQILNDLPFVRILQILCFGTESLKESVFRHQRYGRIFLSPTNAAPIVEIFRLYLDVCRFRYRPLSDPQSYISNLHSHVAQNWGYRPDPLARIRVELMTAILDGLQLSSLDEQLLSSQSPTQCPMLRHDDIEALKARWDWIKRAKLALNIAKSNQINSVANVLASYPGRLRLKKPLDPSQDGPRPNTEHVVNCFRGAARKVLRDRKTYHEYQGRCCKGVDCIEVVPYDKYLWLFLDTIQKYPPGNDHTEQDVGALLQKLHVNETSGKSFQYPEDIAKNIGVVNEGLINIYTGSPLLLVPRIDWNPTESSPPGLGKPVFFVDTKPHPAGLPQNLHRCPGRKAMTYDKREYEWLEAFLKVVTWMEGNLVGNIGVGL